MVVNCEAGFKINKESIQENDSSPKDRHCLKKLPLQYLLIITMLGTALLSSAITISALLLIRSPFATTAISKEIGDTPTKNDLVFKNEYPESNLLKDHGQWHSERNTTYQVGDQKYSVDQNVISTLPNKPKIISRQEWSARPSVEPLTPLRLPVPYVIIHHTATENCSNITFCTFYVRYIQNFHIDNRGWWDIGYNFLVGGDGNAYEGRDWKSLGAHAYGYNSKSIGIAFIGNFNNYLPSAAQIRAAKDLIQIGVEKGYVAKDYKLVAVRQLQATQSPGLMLYEEVKTWPHWSEKL